MPDYALGDYDYLLSQASEVPRSFDALGTKITFVSLRLKPIYVQLRSTSLRTNGPNKKINSILIHLHFLT